MSIVHARAFVVASVLLSATLAPTDLLADPVARSVASRPDRSTVYDPVLTPLLDRLKTAVSAERSAVEMVLPNPAAAPEAAWDTLLRRREETDQRSKDFYDSLESASEANSPVADVADDATKYLKMLRRDVDALHAGIHGAPAGPVERTHAPDEDTGPKDHRINPLLLQPETTASNARPSLAQARLDARDDQATATVLDYMPVVLGFGGVLAASAVWRIMGSRNKDRRFSNRKPCAVAVNLTLGTGTRLRGRMRDISWGGAAIELDDPSLPLRPDERVILNFDSNSAFPGGVVRAQQGIVSLRWGVLTETCLTELDKLMGRTQEQGSESEPVMG